MFLFDIPIIIICVIYGLLSGFCKAVYKRERRR